MFLHVSVVNQVYKSASTEIDMSMIMWHQTLLGLNVTAVTKINMKQEVPTISKDQPPGTGLLQRIQVIPSQGEH